MLSFFPLDVLDEIWDVIEECLTYSLYPGRGMYLHFDLKCPFIIVLSYRDTEIVKMHGNDRRRTSMTSLTFQTRFDIVLSSK